MTKIRGFKFISKEQFEKDFKGLNADFNALKLPKRATAKSAGYDMFSPIEFTLQPNEDIKLPTGIRSYMLDDEVLKDYPRSGHGFKFYIRLANTVGIIDSDYYEADNEGHIFVKLRNEGNKPVTVKQGEAMCQVIFSKYLLVDGDDFSGEKRSGGFGSTSK